MCLISLSHTCTHTQAHKAVRGCSKATEVYTYPMYTYIHKVYIHTCICMFTHIFNLSLSLSLSHTHTHAHTHTYRRTSAKLLEGNGGAATDSFIDIVYGIIELIEISSFYQLH